MVVATAAIPRLDDFEDGISPTDVTQKDAFDTKMTKIGSNKRKTPPRSANPNGWQNEGNDKHHNDANDGSKQM